MKSTIFLILFFLFFFSCNKECFSPPEPFRLIALHEDGTNVINQSNQDSVKLFMVMANDNILINFNMFQYYNVEQDVNIFYIESSELPWRSIEGQKNFLITVGNDTLNIFADVVSKTVKKCTTHPYNLVSCNGTLITDNYDNKVGAFIAE